MILSKKTAGTEVMLEGLDTFTSYYVKVAAYTKEGNGVKSDKMICTTAQDGECSFSTCKNIWVAWHQWDGQSGAQEFYHLKGKI